MNESLFLVIVLLIKILFIYLFIYFLLTCSGVILSWSYSLMSEVFLGEYFQISIKDDCGTSILCGDITGVLLTQFYCMLCQLP